MYAEIEQELTPLEATCFMYSMFGDSFSLSKGREGRLQCEVHAMSNFNFSF
jgi:hypothetical protein